MSDSIIKNIETKISNTKNQTQQKNPIKKTKIENEKIKNITDNNNTKNNNTNNNINSQSLKEENNKNISQLNKESSPLKYKNSIKNFILKNEIFDLYIDNIYNLLLNWILGIPIDYSTSQSTELFSIQNQGKKL